MSSPPTPTSGNQGAPRHEDLLPAFVRDWEQARGQVCAFLLRRLGNPADADDVLQEVSTRAWLGYPSFQRVVPFLAWALRIAANEANRFLGRRRRRPESLAGEENVPAPEQEAPAALHTGWVVEAVEQARQAEELSAEQARVLTARFLAPDATWAQIAPHVGCDTNRCAVLFFRGLQNFRTFLFLDRQDVLRGSARIREAFEEVRPSLSALEARVFSSWVLRGDRRDRPPGWQTSLRSACEKVLRLLEMPLLPTGGGT